VIGGKAKENKKSVKVEEFRFGMPVGKSEENDGTQH
jgi:hypothetical protein